MVFRVGRARFNRKRFRGRITVEYLRKKAVTDPGNTLYMAAFRASVFHHTLDNTTLHVTTELVSSAKYGDTRGPLNIVTLHIINFRTPDWFPKYDDLSDDYRNRLHISILFDSDIKYLEDAEQDRARDFLEHLRSSREWNVGVHETFIEKAHPRTGTFHLAGFGSDNRMRWLHRNGSYYNRPFGHIALYPGGVEP